ncbi:WD40 repeat-like protein [Athelia psychrophila]|uniref:WD40 repeat-like protein n=1 Tax=Athelia psychrophila TaxID=1759441 RepID=A0A166C750_9AGAM|nr:WD40 repeat-like protein [Fibularhizoctonia sp. CBS 109695]
MAFAESKHLDVRKSTFNDIHGSQNTYYINNFFTHPQLDDVRASTETTPLTTPELLAQEWFFDRAEQNSPRERPNNVNSCPCYCDVDTQGFQGSSDLRNWTPGPSNDPDDRRSPHPEESINSGIAIYERDSMVTRGVVGAQTVDAVTAAPEPIASGSVRAQTVDNLGQRPRTRAFRTDYRRPRISSKWYREVPTVVRCVAFSPDGQMVVAGTRDGSVVAWTIPDGRQGLPLRKVHQDSVRAIAFYPDGTRLVTASRDTTLLILCPSSGSVLLGPLRGHTQCIISVAISPDGCFIFSGDKAGILRCWCAKTGSILPFQYRGSSPINSISFSHDGKWVVCGSARLLFFEWQAGEWHFADYPKASFQEAKNVSSVALFPSDGVVICAAGNKIQMWHTITGKEVGRAFDMTDKVHSISASPDGRHFVSGSARGELCICDVRDQRRVATLRVVTALLVTASNMDMYAVAFSPDGQFFVGGGAGGLNIYSYRP